MQITLIEGMQLNTRSKIASSNQVIVRLFTGEPTVLKYLLVMLVKKFILAGSFNQL